MFICPNKTTLVLNPDNVNQGFKQSWLGVLLRFSDSKGDSN